MQLDPSHHAYMWCMLAHADGSALPLHWFRAALLLPCRAGIIEALPDRPDPAMLGGIQPVAREVMTLQGIK